MGKKMMDREDARRAFKKPLAPLKGGRRKATQNLGQENPRPAGTPPAGSTPVGFPLLRGLGGFNTPPAGFPLCKGEQGGFNNTPPTGAKSPCYPADETSANPADNSHGVTTDIKRVRKFTGTTQAPSQTTQSKMKKNIGILTLMLLLATAAKAQIFTMENEVNELRDPVPDPWVENPNEYNLGVDYYAPVGDGIMLLAALGGAYLIRKKKRE